MNCIENLQKISLMFKLKNITNYLVNSTGTLSILWELYLVMCMMEAKYYIIILRANSVRLT